MVLNCAGLVFKDGGINKTVLYMHIHVLYINTYFAYMLYNYITYNRTSLSVSLYLFLFICLLNLNIFFKGSRLDCFVPSSF